MAYCTWRSYKLDISPLRIFEALSSQRNCFFLDSGFNSIHAQGRFSFLGIDPFFILQAKRSNPFRELRSLLNKYKFSAPDNIPFPFSGGAVGYLSYDLGAGLEGKLSKPAKTDLGIPDCLFAFYNSVVAIDHLKKKFYILSLGFPEKNPRLGKLLAESNFKKIHNLISTATTGDRRPATGDRQTLALAPQPNFTRRDYCLAVKKAKEYIKAGDIYQVNLAQRFKAKTNLDGRQIYRRLRSISPSSFGAYFDAGDFQILSSSPERFLKLKGNLASTRPMKGTRPRGIAGLEDGRLRRELLKSKKDQAELVMIVDLERNDLGRVCSYDSVKVAKLRELEEYSTVFQTTATIQGRLHKSKDRIDLLRACFPGGSITGCPKIRAMEIIEELEPERRDIYTGCLGYFSFSGDMDFNILIRTILKKEDDLYFGVGGGIVADSDPESEYEETLVKAKAMLEAIK